MKQLKQYRETTHWVTVRRVAAATIVVGGLSASGFAVGTAGAVSGHAGQSVVVSTVKNNKLGTILVSGKTLYTLNKATKSACTSQCLKIWPQLLLPKGVTKATAGKGVSASKLGTIVRAGGVRQVTYSGKPLYWFSGDKAAGQVKGNVTDTWGTWSDFVTVKPATPSTGSSGAGTGGVAF
jgi:predicted lipoprotein with Yx(FWY)xxD motif